MLRDDQRVTIIVPISTHQTVHPQLEAWIQDELLKRHEIILVIDSDPGCVSIAETLEVIGRIQKLCLSNIVFIYSIEGAPGGARNHGLKIASGQWIYFWDADDWPIVEQALELVHQADSCNADIGVGLANRRAKNDFLVRSSWLHVVRWPGLWRFAFKTSLIRDINFEHWHWCEDQKFLVEALTRCEHVYRGSQVIYNYTVYGQNSLTTIRQNWVYIELFLKYLRSSESKNADTLIVLFFHLKSIFALARYVVLKRTIKEFLYFGGVVFRNRPSSLPRTTKCS